MVSITSSATSTATPPATAAAAAGTTTTPAGVAVGANSVNVLGSDFNTFLKLLTTQLKNQDPLSPLDTNQFTSQLVQFSQVEQAINQNDKLSSLIALQSGQELISALPLVGHTVQFADSQTALVNGRASFAYNLPAQATNATLTISDSSGRIVFQTPAETTAGDHSFAWNGRGNDASQLPDGTYSFAVSATASDQSAIKAALSAFGKVDKVTSSNGAVSVDLNGVSEPLSKILAVTDAGA
jgi:flagellar basal-body rod modification protein FlgD